MGKMLFYVFFFVIHTEKVLRKQISSRNSCLNAPHTGIFLLFLLYLYIFNGNIYIVVRVYLLYRKKISQTFFFLNI